jgi:hypothetical protein
VQPRELIDPSFFRRGEAAKEVDLTQFWTSRSPSAQMLASIVLRRMRGGGSEGGSCVGACMESELPRSGAAVNNAPIDLLA